MQTKIRNVHTCANDDQFFSNVVWLTSHGCTFFESGDTSVTWKHLCYWFPTNG